MSTTQNIYKPIVLIGSMGCGKSAIGKRLAKKLKMPFYDIDEVIESRKMLTLVDIYDLMGKEYLRELEISTLEEVMKYGTSVISTSGNTPLSEQVFKFVKESSISVGVLADIEIVYERLTRRDTRPTFLYAKNKMEFVKSIVDEMNKVSDKLDVVVYNNNSQPHQVAYYLARHIRETYYLN